MSIIELLLVHTEESFVITQAEIPAEADLITVEKFEVDLKKLKSRKSTGLNGIIS